MYKPKLRFKTAQSPDARVIQSDSGRDILMFVTYNSLFELNFFLGYNGHKAVVIKPIKIGIRRAA